MNNFKEFVDVDTPTPADKWLSLSEEERIKRVVGMMEKYGYLDQICVLAAHANGNVLVNLINDMSAGERGSQLLNVEEMLKRSLDNGISVWLEPRSDKSKLRNLRGVQVKA